MIFGQTPELPVFGCVQSVKGLAHTIGSVSTTKQPTSALDLRSAHLPRRRVREDP